MIKKVLLGFLLVAFLATGAMAQSTTYRSLIGAEDVSQWDGVSSTFTRKTSTGGSITLHKLGSGTYVDVAQVYGSGTISQTALQNALNAIGTTNKRTLRLAAGAWTLTSAVTIPSNITLDLSAGAVITKGAGGSITINGQIISPPVACFSGFTGPGVDVTLGAGVLYYWEQWFGTGDDLVVSTPVTVSDGITSTAAVTINMPSAGAPIVLGANGQDQLVTGLYAAKAASAPGAFLQCTLLTTGTSFTTHASATKVWLKMVGGGGGGGGVTGDTSKAACGAGGSSATYAEKIFTVTGSTAYTYAIGAGGTAGSSAGGDGGTGGNTTFAVGGTTVTAPGGGGGQGMTAGTTSAYTSAASATTGATNADFSVTGTTGEFGHRVSGTDGWGGSGRSGPFGSGGAPKITTGYGNTAGGYGAGGGGARTTTTDSYTGGVGSPGAIWACEYR
jgi:hypothetical protein